MIFDDELLTQIIFHPRPESQDYSPAGQPTLTQTDGAAISGYLHPCPTSDTLLIFFHGNGEIAADYDSFAPMYVDCGVSFWVVDYRGYGRSTGTPSFSQMLADAEAIYADIPRIGAVLQQEFARVIVMGRSLGSASAIHLAAMGLPSLAGLVLDSPYADGLALVSRLSGLGPQWIGSSDFEDNLGKMRRCELPTLIIHGTYDRVIPVADAEALFDACPHPIKQLLKVEGGGHNDLLLVAFSQYYEALKSYVARIVAGA